MPHVRSGRLRPLAAMSHTRIPLVSDVPTTVEAGYAGAESGFWHGSLVPAGTPVEVVTTLHEATMKTLRRDDIARRLVDVGYSVVGEGPASFQQFLAAEIRKWKKVVEDTGLSAN